MKKITIYDREKGKAIFKIFEDGRTYIGIAKVHPDDKVMASELTGLTIAEYRAKIKRQTAKINEAHMKYKALEKELITIDQYIKDRVNALILLTDELDTFISDKEKFYKSYQKLLAKR